MRNRRKIIEDSDSEETSEIDMDDDVIDEEVFKESNTEKNDDTQQNGKLIISN